MRGCDSVRLAFPVRGYISVAEGGTARGKNPCQGIHRPQVIWLTVVH